MVRRFFGSVAVLAVLSGCSQADRANVHLGAMDQTSREMLVELKKAQTTLDSATKQVEAIAVALTALKDMGVDVMNIMKAAFQRKPEGDTDDIDDVLGEPLRAPFVSEDEQHEE